MPGKEGFFVFLLLSLIIPYQALVTPLFFMFAKLQLTNSLVGLAILHTAIQMPFSDLRHAQQLRSGAARARRGGSDRRLQQLAGAGARLPAGDRAGHHHSLAVRLRHVVERATRRARDDEQGSTTFTLPLVARHLRAPQTSIGGTDWGMLQAGITISIIPCLAFYLLLQKYYVAGFLSGAVK